MNKIQLKVFDLSQNLFTILAHLVVNENPSNKIKIEVFSSFKRKYEIAFLF
jgi:hypothetical protein